MKYKMLLDAEGKVIGIAADAKGNPIVIQEKAGPDGEDKEIGLDAIHLFTKVPSLQEEAKNHRLKAKGYKDFVDALEEAEIDVSDPIMFKSWLDEATGAIGTVKNLDDKKLIDANEVDSIKKQAVEAHDKRVKEMEVKHAKVLDGAQAHGKGLEDMLFELMVSQKFTSSKFVTEKLNMPPKVARAYFGQNFKVEKKEDGTYHVVSYHKGEKLFSEERVGEAPDFEEAMGLLVARDNDRDALMVGGGQGGSGAGDGKPGPGGAPNQNPWIKGPYFNLTGQGTILNTDPQRAARMQTEANTVNANNGK